MKRRTSAELPPLNPLQALRIIHRERVGYRDWDAAAGLSWFGRWPLDDAAVHEAYDLRDSGRAARGEPPLRESRCGCVHCEERFP